MAGAEVFAIVGGGQAGAWAARTLRQQGFAGRIVLFSEEAHPPYERPPLSKQVLLGEAPADSAYIFAQQVYADANIELCLRTRVAALESGAHRLVLARGESFQYDRLLLTTGAQPRRLIGARGANVFYLRSLADAAAIGSRLVAGARVLVVGGGWIGLEVAAAAHKRDCTVTVVETANRVCSRAAPEDLSHWLLALHQAQGVDVRLDSYVVAFEGDEDVRRVVLSTGDAIDVSTVVVGVGIIPATELAERAGLYCENGIAIDAQMRTSAPDVYAAGDVASYIGVAGARRRLESWDNAQKQGVAAGKAMLGIETKLDVFPWFWSDQFDINVQLVGEFAEYDECLPIVAQHAASRITLYRRREALVGVVGINAGREIRAIKRSLENGQPLPQSLLVATQRAAQAIGA